MKTWLETITPYLKKSEKITDKIFSDFEKEKKAKKIKSVSEENSLWRSQYAPKLKAIEDKHEIEYMKIWNKHHKK
jgi:hypothetical protein